MKFISITKPGIIFGNIVTLLGGFLLASPAAINIGLLLTAIVGMSLVIACGCVLNNYIDRDIDVLMERTKNRATVTGLISGRVAILYAVFLGIAGFIILYLQTNFLTVFIAAIGFIVYVAAYTIWLKRKSGFGTVMGGIAGAVPPLVGYCAVTDHFDTAAVILFVILFLWQIPHFHAIAIYRLHDFAAARIPVLPITRGMRYTKINMVCYTIAFTLSAVMPTVFGYAGWRYFTVALLLGIAWLYLNLQGFRYNNDRLWARKMFLFSIVVIMGISLMMWAGVR